MISKLVSINFSTSTLQSIIYLYSIMTTELFFVFVVWLTYLRLLALLPAGTIVRDPHHCKPPTRHEQSLNLHRWFQLIQSNNSEYYLSNILNDRGTRILSKLREKANTYNLKMVYYSLFGSHLLHGWSNIDWNYMSSKSCINNLF